MHSLFQILTQGSLQPHQNLRELGNLFPNLYTNIEAIVRSWISQKNLYPSDGRRSIQNQQKLLKEPKDSLQETSLLQGNQTSLDKISEERKTKPNIIPFLWPKTIQNLYFQNQEFLNKDFFTQEDNFRKSPSQQTSNSSLLPLYIEGQWRKKVTEDRYLKIEEEKPKTTKKNPYSLKTKSDFLRNKINQANSSKSYHFLTQMVYYYVATILLEEELSPTNAVGKSFDYIEEYAKAISTIDRLISEAKELDPLEKLQKNLLELLKEHIKKIESITIQSKQIIEKNLHLNNRKEIDLLDSILKELESKIVTEKIVHSAFLEKKDSIYAKTKNKISFFDQESPSIIKETSEKIKQQKTEKQIRKLFSDLSLEELGNRRNQIAKKDRSEKGEMFGKYRFDNLKTELKGRYREHQAKIFNLIKEAYENWLEIKEKSSPSFYTNFKNNTSDEESILDLENEELIQVDQSSLCKKNSFYFVKKEENKNFKNRTITFYKNQKFHLSICIERDAQKLIELSRFIIEPLSSFCLEDSFPSFHSCAMTLHHTHHSFVPTLMEDLEAIFVECTKKNSDSLKTDLARFVYFFAHTCPYYRGSAAINEWFRDSILLAHGYKTTYGKSIEINNTIYQEVSDLDALTSSYQEFETMFVKKIITEEINISENTSKKILEIQNPKENQVELILKKLSSWKNISLDKISKTQKKELHQQKIILFFFAIEKGLSEVVETLLEDEEIDINSTDSYGSSLFLFACECNRLPIIELIWKKRKHDLNPNHQDTVGNTPFLHACIYNNVEIAKILLTHPNIDVNKTDFKKISPFHAACILNQIEMVEFLLSFRKKVPNLEIKEEEKFSKSYLSTIIRNCSQININLPMEVSLSLVPRTPLASASNRGLIKIVDLLLSEPDIDVNLGNPLLEACNRNQLESVQRLLKHPKIKITKETSRYLS